MELNKFINLCKAIGKSDIPSGEEWKAVKYIHTPGQGSPAADVELLLEDGKIDFLNDADKPGFIISEAPAGDILLPINDNTPVTTFFDLNHITDLSFVVDDDVVDIYDVVNKIKETTFPVRIWFSVESTTKYDNDIPIFVFDNVNDIRLGFKMSRKLVKDTDYDIVFKNSSNEVVAAISEPGKYTMTITCKGKYVGSSSCKIIINK